jgi:hypothetical protein
VFLPIVDELIQITSVYIFCRQKSQYKQLARQYRKVKSISSDIRTICRLIKEEVHHGEQVLMPMIILSDTFLDAANHLDKSFLYSYFLKQALLNFQDTNQRKEEFIKFCRQQYADNGYELKIIDEFEQTYDPSSPIYWYTRECFIYAMLNKALRTHDIEIIMRIDWFIRDMHRQIEQLHKQSNIQHPFVVYRGQGVSLNEFEKIKGHKGCILAFSNFLSTSRE